jgi:hypothetical protein
MRAARIVAVIAGALMAFAGFGATAGGVALVSIHATQRDSAGYYRTPTERFDTSTAVLTTRLDLGSAGRSGDVAPAHPIGTVQIRATAVGERPLFIGIAAKATVDGWLAGAAYQEVTGARSGPFRAQTKTVTGERSLPPPGEQTFWVASVSGTGTQTLTWTSEPGNWTVVLMNADARPGVAADVSAGARTGLLLPVGLIVGGIGVLLLAGGLVMIMTALRGTAVAAAPNAPAVPGTYPVRLDGRLDQPSRWLWLVKWLLVIPHLVVLALLWLAFVVLTVMAGFGILFTGRYPKSIFDFNVGVLRWNWRVTYYAYSALATDRYPPFSLRPDPTYPADFTVDYPQRLSRGLVLVKWWLLAIPHYIVVGLLAGGGYVGWSSRNGQDWRPATGGLIGILVLVAAVMLLFSGRYPKSLYDLVMGLNRWVYRVVAYAALMRDEYPPFRLDAGGTDPGSRPVPPPPPPPQSPGPQSPPRGDELICSAAGSGT